MTGFGSFSDEEIMALAEKGSIGAIIYIRISALEQYAEKNKDALSVIDALIVDIFRAMKP